MNKVTGKILLEETGVGIPNLIVTVYDVDRNTMPEFALPVTAEKRILKVIDVWEHLQGDRLGSVLTDKNGLFVLDYEDSDFQRNDEGKRPDLMLFVTAPERSGMENCAAVLHVSCGIRQNAGRLETYVIKLPIDQLKKAGIPMLGVALFQLPQNLSQDDLVYTMKQLADQRRNNEDVDQRPFSKRYKELQQKQADDKKKAALINSFTISTPICLSSGGNLLSEAQLYFEACSNSFMFCRTQNAQPVTMRFEGVSYDPVPPMIAAGVLLLVNEDAGTFQVSVPSSSGAITHPENGPTALYQLFTSLTRPKTLKQQ